MKSLLLAMTVLLAGSALAEERHVVLLGGLDAWSSLVRLQDNERRCRYYGHLEQESEQNFQILISREVCLDPGNDAVVERSVQAKAWLGQLPPLKQCAGVEGCPRMLPAGTSLSVGLGF